MNTTEIRQEFLISRDGFNYPPHHAGDHLEEAFVKFWQKNGSGNRLLIPVHWTAVYNYKVKEGLGSGTPNHSLRQKLQSYLDSLPKDGLYFIVCTHDDAPSERLPPNTQVFAAGGNSERIDVAIPLTCGAHSNILDPIRTIPMSFVGSVTHMLRQHLLMSVNGKPGLLIQVDEWQENVSQQKSENFKQITQNSMFSLCPRGYGATSYRLYEAIQLGAVPVYVSDKHLLPWNDELDWESFCVIVKPHEIQRVLDMTFGMGNKKFRKMQQNLDTLWEEYFSIEATCRHISKRIK
jgi:hypothetical protein